MSPVGTLFDKELLDNIRNRFLAVEEDVDTGKRIFLDAAAGNFKLKTLIPVLARESGIPGQTISDLDPASVRIKKILEQGEKDWRIFMNAKDGVIWPDMTGSLINSHLIYAAAEYLPGKNIVSTNMEHPSVYDTVRHVSKKYGKELRTAQVTKTSGRVEPADIVKLVDADTAFVYVVHASNTTGAYNDIETICREVKKANPNVFIFIDGIQYAPVGPIDVAKWQPDAYVYCPYKVSCVRGIAIAYLSERMARIPHQQMEGLPETQWLMGSKNHANYAAWTDTMDYLAWLGGNFIDSSDRRDLVFAAMSAIKEHVLGLAGLMVDGLKSISGVHVYGADEMRGRNSLTVFSIDGYSTDELMDMYCREHIHLRARHLDTFAVNMLKAIDVDFPVLRVSASHCAAPWEIEHFLTVTRDFAARRP